MSFIPRIKPRDQYLRDFFRPEEEDPMANLLNEGDPYEPIPVERLVEMRETKSKPVPSTLDSFIRYSGLGGLREAANWLYSKPGFRPLAEDFPAAQEKAEEIADVIAGPVDLAEGQTEKRLPKITGFPDYLDFFSGKYPSELEAGARGFGAGLIENPLKNVSAVDFAPFGRAAKYAGAAADITKAGEGFAKGLRAASNLKGTEKGSLLLESPEYVAKALEGSAQGLQGLERASGAAQGVIAAGQAPTALENLEAGNILEGSAGLAQVIAGAALTGRSTADNWLSPEKISFAKKGISDVGEGNFLTKEALDLLSTAALPISYAGGLPDVAAPGVGAGILSHGRYLRPEETEPVNPKLIERSNVPFQEANKSFLENESMQDQFDVLRRMEDVVKRNAEVFVPGETGSLEGITFDPSLRGGNLGGAVRLNTESIARNAPDLESYLQRVGEILTHEDIGHGTGVRPHGQELIDEAGRRVMMDETPSEADIELGQTRMAMPENPENFREDLPESRTRPFEDIEGYYQKEPTDADFAFRIANEAAQNAVRKPIEDVIGEYLNNPNDRATLEHAFLMQRGERPRGSSYRDYTDQAVDLPTETYKPNYADLAKEWNALEEDLQGGNLDPYTPEWNKRAKRQQEVWKQMQELGDRPLLPIEGPEALSRTSHSKAQIEEAAASARQNVLDTLKEERLRPDTKEYDQREYELMQSNMEMVADQLGIPIDVIRKELGWELPESQSRVFHGTPYDFDKFSDEAIGSGEGSQAFGRGHYQAEDPKLGRYYGESIAGRGRRYTLASAAYNLYKSNNDSVLQAVQATKNYISTLNQQLQDKNNTTVTRSDIREKLKDQVKILDLLKSGKFRPEHTLLSVEIPEGPYVELDKTLAEQSPEIQNVLPQINQARRKNDYSTKAVHDIEAAIPYLKSSISDTTQGKVNLASLENHLHNYKEWGDEKTLSLIDESLQKISIDPAIWHNYPIYNILDKIRGQIRSIAYAPDIKDKPYTEWFETPSQIEEAKQRGIKGIKFRDRRSRYSDTETPTHNYVIFDPEDAKIVGKRKNLTEAELIELEQKYGRENLSRNVESFYEGQKVEIVRRRGNSVTIRLPDGTEKVIGFSKLRHGVIQTPETKGQYEDLTSELEALEKELSGEQKVGPDGEGYVEPIPTIDPSAVSVVAEDKHILPENYIPMKRGRPVKAKEVSENIPDVEGTLPVRRLGDEGPFGAYKGENVETQELSDLGRSIKEGTKVEKAQSGEIIKDQSFRDKIQLQDQILKAQELEALKKGDAEGAAKAAMERKILRAQNAEEFATYKKKVKESTEKVRQAQETAKLEQKILQEQAKEAAGKSPIDIVARAAEGIKNEAEFGPRKPETPSDYLLEASSFLRSVRSSFDIGPIARQARSATLAHPLKGLEFGKKSIEAYFSHEKAAEIEKDIFSHPKFKERINAQGTVEPSIATESGLKLIGTGFDPGAEIHGSYYAPKVPILGAGVRAAERSSQAYVNLMRSHLFNEMTRAIEYGPDTKSQYQAAAKAANLFTGRGQGGKVIPEQAIPFLNSLTWGVRHQLAKYQQFVNTFKAQFDPNVPKEVKMEYLRQGSALVATGLAGLATAKVLGAKVTDDPKDKDFGAARWGNIIWRPFGAGTTDAVRMVQFFTGRGEGQGEKKPFDPKILTDLWFNPDTGTGRVAPLISSAWQGSKSGEYAQLPESGLTDLGLGEIPSKALGQVEPLNVTGIGEAIGEVGPVGALLGIPMSLGESIDVQSPKKFHEKKKKKGQRKGKVLGAF